ncbi:hypothetical protein ACFY40_27825 [Streptomyces sp. NPDC012950]|uniref:hypothetical protein n=1 Tax=Streptomyces sp. NPDC012950 TaxID=3364858 RepID=UPI0036A59649
MSLFESVLTAAVAIAIAVLVVAGKRVARGRMRSHTPSDTEPVAVATSDERRTS